VFRHLPLGVTLFFALSAFLLYRPIAAAVLAGEPRPATRPYLRNRGLRILPAYWVVLLATAVVLPAAVLRTGPGSLELGRMTHDPGLLLRNGVLVQNYSPESVLTGIAPAWSLAVEVVFYLVLPVLGLLAAGLAARAGRVRGRVLAVLVPAGVLLVTGLSGKAAADRWITPAGGPSPGWDGDWHSVVVRSFWGQADLFTFGMVLAVLHVAVHRGLVVLPRWWRWPAWAALLGIAATLAVLTDRAIWAAGRNPYELTAALGCALLLALVVLPRATADRGPGLLVRLLSTRAAVLVGLCSYSVFLWHEPLIRLLRSHGWTMPGRGGLLVNLVVVGALTAILAAATYRWVERPALRRKRRSTSPGPAAAA
jgi:peptidoglycan/LPS O-acetylase OafA/YrhL